MKAAFHLIIPACLSFAISFSLNNFSELYTPFWWISVLCHGVLAIAIISLGHLKTDVKSFTELLLGLTAGKLLVLMSFYFLFSYLTGAAGFAFVVHFMIHYVLFTVLEVRYLLNLIQDKVGESHR